MLTVLPAPIGPKPLCFCTKLKRKKMAGRTPDKNNKIWHLEGEKNRKF